MPRSTKIHDYSLIGNCRSAALVSKYGSIDWCCLPEFHSPAIFSALLDNTKGGYFSICPASDFNSTQAYIEDTNVVETSFTTKEGTVKLTDAFAANSEEEKLLSLFPDHEILRVITCTSGAVNMKMEFVPKIFYGKKDASLTNNKKLGIKFSSKENSFILLTTLSQEQITVASCRADALFTIAEGQRVVISLSCSSQSPAILPELQSTAGKRMEATISYWHQWIDQCKYDGIYKKEVRRSALALKLLAHAPSGAIIAAPTTSLPEYPGGERNWDYRYCWLRDASFTIRALINLGFHDEAHAYMNWILHATQLTRPKLQVLYSVYGKTGLQEQTLDWLAGYEDSKPVRIGNGAHNQFQLDVYGEVLDAFFSYSAIITEFDMATKYFLLGLGEVICKQWDQPDNGIWEMRSSPAHHTHSKVMAWVGLDRLIKLCKRYKWKGVPVEKYESIKKEIVEQVETFGFSDQTGSYTRSFNENSLDASSLVFSLVGYCPADAPKMRSTIENICKHLSEKNLIYRYRAGDGLAGVEGAFGICNFWLAENFARAGKIEDAIAIFDSFKKSAGPTGLLSEEIDPDTFELLGNYPQGFTHIGLINAALSINASLNNEKSLNDAQYY